MSERFPSRRELRLQREREQQLQESAGSPQEAVKDILAPAPKPASPQEPENEKNSSELTEPRAKTVRRRADAEVTATQSIAVLQKSTDTKNPEQPRSRREKRALEEQRAAQLQKERERLQGQQDEQEAPKRTRRATAPQTAPKPVPATGTTGAEVPDEREPSQEIVDAETSEQIVDIEFTSSHELTALNITDTSGLDIIELRRKELRSETERLTQEIMDLGQSNPNVIDPQMLRRQKQLAEKSQELQKLETAAIEIVESEKQAARESDTTNEAFTEEVSTGTEQQDSRKNRRRTRDTPFVTGPFEVIDTEEITNDQQPVHRFLPARPLDAPAKPKTREPVEASTAHGLDTLDPKAYVAGERRLIISAIAMFVIGILTLIIAIILLSN